MKKNKYTGKYLNAFLSNKVFKPEGKEEEIQFELNDNETIYIYSFKESKLTYAKGFDKVYGIKNKELTAQKLNSLFTSNFRNFFDEYHDRVLLYFYNNNQHLSTFKMNTIIKVNHFEDPILLCICVFDTDNNGNLISVIGKGMRNLEIKSTDIVQYSFNGKGESSFMEKINHHLDFQDCISQKDIELIEELSMPITLEQVSENLDLSEEHIQFYTNNLLSRFKLNTVDELIEFAKNNHLIPNQFKKLGI